MSCIECLKRFSIFEVGQKLQPDCDLGKGVKDPEHSHPGLALTHTFWLKQIGIFFVFSNSPKNRDYETGLKLDGIYPCKGAFSGQLKMCHHVLNMYRSATVYIRRVRGRGYGITQQRF